MTGLESICGDIFAQAINQTTDPKLSVEDMLVNIETRILPEWKSHLRIFAGMEKKWCKYMLKLERTRLIELGNRSTDVSKDIKEGWLEYLKTQLDDELRYIDLAYPDHTPFSHQPQLHTPSNHNRVVGSNRSRGHRNDEFIPLPLDNNNSNANMAPSMSFNQLMSIYMNTEHIPTESAYMPVGSNSSQFQLGPDIGPPSRFPRYFEGLLPPPSRLDQPAPFARQQTFEVPTFDSRYRPWRRSRPAPPPPPPPSGDIGRALFPPPLESLSQLR